MEYLLKANAIIILFYLCYKLFLQKETFFESNRFFLLTGLAVASIIPFIVIPIYIESTVTSNFEFSTLSTVTETDTVAAFSFIKLLEWLYIIGTAFFIIKFLIECISLSLILIQNKRQKQGRYTFIETQKEHSPFSFFKFIVYNPNHFTIEELEHIIIHEKVHAKQYHSIDILITKIAATLFWFNPFVWLYNKSLQQNLEFIADNKAQEKVNNSKTYQVLLLKTSVSNNQLTLANNFYNSLIKKRIIMLHKSKSNNLNTLKYALVLPALALFLMSFNTEEIVIPIENETISEKTINDIEVAIFSKDATKSELNDIKKQFKTHGVNLSFKGIKRNKEGEITKIKITAESKNGKTKYETSSDDPISSIKIEYNSDKNKVSIKGQSKSSNSFHFDSNEGEHKIITKGDNEYVYVVNETKHKAHKKEKKHKEHKSSSSVYVFSSDDDEEYEHENIEVIIKDTDDNEVKKDKKRVFITKGNGKQKVIEINNDNEDVIIMKDKDGNIIKEKIIIETTPTQSNTWVDDNGKVFKVKTKSNVYFSPDNIESPLVIIDGKASSTYELNKIKPNDILSMNVLKGKTAIELYGDKGKDGVIIIKIK